MSKFTRYRVFVAIVDNGNLAAAADALFMSPSSVSKHLSNLELELKSNLIDRNTHKLTMTETGLMFYDLAKNGRLVKLPISQKFLRQEFSLLFHKRDHMPLRINTFKEFIKVRLPQVFRV